MKCEGCGADTSVATYSPDASGLMCWWCTDCANERTAEQFGIGVCAHCGGRCCSQLKALQAQLAVPPVLRPLSTQQIEDALNEGAAQSQAARGDNAFAYLLRQRDELKAALAEACDGWALDAGDDWPRIAELRKLAEGA